MRGPVLHSWIPKREHDGIMNILNIQRVAFAAILTVGIMAVSSPSTSREVAQVAPQSTMMPMPGMGGGMGGNGRCGDMSGMMGTATTPSEIAMRDAMMSEMGPRSGEPTAWSGNPDLDYVTMALRHARVTLALARTEVKYGKEKSAVAFARTTIATQRTAIAKLEAMLQSMHR